MITKSHPSTNVIWPQYITGPVRLVDRDGCPDSTRQQPSFTSFVTVPGDTIQYENSNRRRFNYCLHTKDNLKVNLTSAHWHSRYSSVTDRAYAWYYGCPATPLKPTRPSDAVILQISEEMRKRAWQELLPRLETGFSLINFFWELKDFPRLLGTCRNLMDYIRRVFTSEMKSSSRTASDLFLSWQFAIAPFMRDVESIADLLDKTNKAVNDFIAAGRKPQTFHYVEELEEASSSTPTSTYFLKTVGTRGTYRATLRCMYDYKKPSFLDSLRRLWGLRVTPEALWNAIPFSFVVDWVFKVGNALEQFDRDPNLKIYILDYCDSIKTESFAQVTRLPAVSGCDVSYSRKTWGAGGPDLVWEWTRTRYNRVPTLPNTGYAFPVMDGLSRRELLLTAALLLT